MTYKPLHLFPQLWIPCMTSQPYGIFLIIWFKRKTITCISSIQEHGDIFIVSIFLYMWVIMGVPIFVHFGASHVLPHGTSGLEPHFDIYQSQFAHWCNQEQEFSKIFFKNNDNDYFGFWGVVRDSVCSGQGFHKTPLGSIWGSLSLISTPHRVLTFGTPYFSAREPAVHLQTTSSFG